MTRIVAGVAGGRRLQVPRGERTRPTSERVREALFSWLDARDAVAGQVVADLYAGSGALGLEAVSRGASSAVLVEADRTAAAAAKANATGLGLSGVRVVTDRVERWAAGAAGRNERYGLVLCDPPYGVAETDLATVLGAVAELLTGEATLVVERDTRSPEPTWPGGLTRADHRTYGETALWFAVTPERSRE